ncbi:hypothetical protein R3I93_003190 [Phoxinus phoxinus]|uniref:Uncharacterized protein n=1 Tax=Phoxinus phoxinus TaxID=58324 RepID=A0AAN9DL66_9TELE
MKVLLYVCFILFFSEEATGQLVDPVCVDIADFDPCNDNGLCDQSRSRCSCLEGQPFCRCNSKEGEFYIDENCSQKWTVVTFALVASLPGLTLAALVGVIVYVMMLLQPKKRHTGEEMKTPNTAFKEQDLFPGIHFASDMNGQPPPNMRPVQQNPIPLTAMANRPYRSVHPSAGSMTDARPRETNSMYNGMRDDPPMGGPVQPYSNGTGRGQIVSNAYARDSPSRNPYEDDRPSAEHNHYRPHAPSNTNEDLNRPYSPAPLYSSSEHGNLRNGFPRPQLNLQL